MEVKLMRKWIIVCLISLFVIPFVMARNYGEGRYGMGLYGIGEEIEEEVGGKGVSIEGDIDAGNPETLKETITYLVDDETKKMNTIAVIIIIIILTTIILLMDIKDKEEEG